MKLDLENDNVLMLDMAKEEARAVIDGDEITSFDEALDEVQSKVTSEYSMYLVIKISA